MVNAVGLCSLSLVASGGPPPQSLSIFDPASPQAQSIRDFSILVFAIIGGIFLVVEGVLVYSIYRFRHSAKPGATEPPQVYGSKPIEIAWTAAPTLIVFVLMLVTTRTLWEVSPNQEKPPPGSRPLNVTVIGHQWWWEYVYECYDDKDLGFITANELHVPASEAGELRPTYLALQSADVCHSYWIPRLGGKTDLLPGRTNHMWFSTKLTGLYLGQCAEYCGTQHAGMLLRVSVDPAPTFDRWLANEQRPAVDDPAVVDGKKIFLGQSCVNCHRIRGTTANGTYAPDLTHLMSRQTLASGMVPNDAKHLRDWIADPQKPKPGCLMPAFGLSERELDLVVKYLLSLR